MLILTFMKICGLVQKLLLLTRITYSGGDIEVTPDHTDNENEQRELLYAWYLEFRGHELV